MTTLLVPSEDGVQALSVPSEDAAAERLVYLRSEGVKAVWAPGMGSDEVQRIAGRAAELIEEEEDACSVS
jgi:hypothetical protein